MKTLSLFYATNRGHEGNNRFRPGGYGAKFSGDGSENLRFGKRTIQADERKINEFLNAPAGMGWVTEMIWQNTLPHGRARQRSKPPGNESTRDCRCQSTEHL